MSLGQLRGLQIDSSPFDCRTEFKFKALIFDDYGNHIGSLARKIQYSSEAIDCYQEDINRALQMVLKVHRSHVMHNNIGQFEDFLLFDDGRCLLVNFHQATCHPESILHDKPKFKSDLGFRPCTLEDEQLFDNESSFRRAMLRELRRAWSTGCHAIVSHMSTILETIFDQTLRSSFVSKKFTKRSIPNKGKVKLKERLVATQQKNNLRVMCLARIPRRSNRTCS